MIRKILSISAVTIASSTFLFGVNTAHAKSCDTNVLRIKADGPFEAIQKAKKKVYKQAKPKKIKIGKVSTPRWKDGKYTIRVQYCKR